MSPISFQNTKWPKSDEGNNDGNIQITAWDVASFGSFCNCVDCEDVANYMAMDFDRELYRTMILRTGLVNYIDKHCGR
jgi:hypothetical protein